MGGPRRRQRARRCRRCTLRWRNAYPFSCAVGVVPAREPTSGMVGGGGARRRAFARAPDALRQPHCEQRLIPVPAPHRSARRAAAGRTAVLSRRRFVANTLRTLMALDMHVFADEERIEGAVFPSTMSALSERYRILKPQYAVSAKPSEVCAAARGLGCVCLCRRSAACWCARACSTCRLPPLKFAPYSGWLPFGRP